MCFSAVNQETEMHIAQTDEYLYSMQDIFWWDYNSHYTDSNMLREISIGYVPTFSSNKKHPWLSWHIDTLKKITWKLH